MNFQIRNALPKDARRLAEIHVKSWQESYYDLLPKSYLNHLSYSQRLPMWQKILSNPAELDWVWVVENPDRQVIGFCHGGLPRRLDLHYDCELYSIYLLNQYKNLGIGKALFESFQHKCIHSGFKNLYLWVLEGNPSTSFYEHLGATLCSNILEDVIGGVNVKERLYAFRLST